MLSKKKIFGFTILILIICCIVYLINKPITHNNILGTYRNQENSFNTISFDTETSEYIENIYDVTSNKNFKNNGKFLQENGNIEFLDGKYAKYQIKFKNNILIIFSAQDITKFDKINDVPIIIDQ